MGNHEGDGIPLLEHAARQCFWGLGVSTLRELAKYLKLAVDKPTLFSVVEALINHVLPKLTQAQVFELLSMRTFSRAFIDAELLQKGVVCQSRWTSLQRSPKVAPK